MKKIEQNIWHPYSSTTNPSPTFFVESANGVRINLKNNVSLIDGMSSWWAAIHGYNNPALNKAANNQLSKMSHIMFGGFTHAPAQELAELLLKILPSNKEKDNPQKELTKIFFADSGSVSVEVAMKMAIQYWHSRGYIEKTDKYKDKTKFATISNGYHGDTWNAMSVCDPITGMHSLFGSSLPINYFTPSPKTTYGFNSINNFKQKSEEYYLKESKKDIEPIEQLFKNQSNNIAAFILEPIVQGAGGMKFYPPIFLVLLKELCTKYNILLIFDEIATGFGRTGKMFAMEHSNILPDILTIGKGLTGGYLTMAATICTTEVAETICNAQPGVFMHGPTFMGNPLACSIACASIKELLSKYKQGTKNTLERINQIQSLLIKYLSPASKLSNVANVRVLGAIGVIEMKDNVNLSTIQPMFVKKGIWLRPFGKLVYTMPPYIISDSELKTLCNKTIEVLKNYK